MGQPGGALEAAVAWCRAPAPAAAGPASQPRRPARSRAALAGAPRRRGDNGGRQSARAARAPSPPAGLTPSPPLRRGGWLRPRRSPPTHRLRSGRSEDRRPPAAGRLRQRPDFLWNQALLESRRKSNHYIQNETLRGGRGIDGFSG